MDNITSNLILDEILGIKDLRTDTIVARWYKGAEELKERVDSGNGFAMALYPVTMKQLMTIANAI